jgi:phosphate transport system substrate-binding protein
MQESGLWAAFKKVTIGMANNFQGKLVQLTDPRASKYFLEQKKGGIVYVGYASFDESAGIALSIDGVKPTMENFRNAAYPLIARYYLTYNRDKLRAVQPFLDFIFSPEGQSIINRRMIATEPSL